jgi:hypothetical protein
LDKDILTSKLLLQVLSGGTPPQYGLSRYTVGEIEKIISHLDEEYGDTFELCDQGFAKFILAPFGSGKTHFALQFRETFMKRGTGCVSSYIELTHNQIGMDDLASIVKEVIKNLEFPKSDEEIIEILSKPSLAKSSKGLRESLQKFLRNKEKELCDDPLNREPFIHYVTGLKKEIRTGPIGSGGTFARAFEKLIDGIVYENFSEIEDMNEYFLGNLSNEKIKKYEFKKLDKTNSIDSLNELVRILKILGFVGLILIFDESEFQLVSKSKTKRRNTLEQLRQIIDQIHSQDIPSVILLFTILDKEQIQGVHGALTSRVKTEFSLENTLGHIIDLEQSDQKDEFLLQELKNLSIKIMKVFEKGRNTQFDQEIVKNNIINICKIGVKYRRGDLSSKRSFITFLIKIFEKIKINPDKQFTEDEIEQILIGSSETSEIDKEDEEKYFVNDDSE